MKLVRRSKERGYFDHGWLRTFHTFSFSQYFEPEWMGFGPLRVINEDWIEKGKGFPTHGHRDMEIITYVVEGAVAHKDSTGSSGEVRPGEVQKMSAGHGIRHSEYNGDKNKDTHMYQIWIMPDKTGLEPKYWQKDFSGKLDSGEPVCIVASDEREGALPIHQDVALWARRFKTGMNWDIKLDPKRIAWVQIVRGEVNVAGEALIAGDGIALAEESAFMIEAKQGSEVLVFDMGVKK